MEIYQWVKAHVGYVGTSDKSDWKKEAYRESLTVSVIALPIMWLLKHSSPVQELTI